MKKKSFPKENDIVNEPNKLPIVEDFSAVYLKSNSTMPSLKNFTFQDFKKIASNTPFSLTEWSAMLHVSERTLQRYSKNNGLFAPINAERALQIDKLIKKGNAVFGSVDAFYNWLKRNPYMLERNLSFASLSTADGINNVMIQLGRIEQGLFA